jgi:hypothetical protein
MNATLIAAARIEAHLVIAADFKFIRGVRCSRCCNEAPTFRGECLRCFRVWKDAHLADLLQASVDLARAGAL